jgi:hypothetical protein
MDNERVVYPWQRPPRRGFSSSAPGGYGRISTEGYVQVRWPNPKRQTLEHRLVWEFHNGPIPEGWHIHHKNGNRSDNRIENLEAINGRLHHRLKHSSYIEHPDGSFTKRCTACNKELALSEFYQYKSGVRKASCLACFRAYALKRYHIRTKMGVCRRGKN